MGKDSDLQLRDEPEDEEELEDPATVLREKCSALNRAKLLMEEMHECESRVERGSEESCEQELCDYLLFVDNCIARTLFSKLK